MRSSAKLIDRCSSGGIDAWVAQQTEVAIGCKHQHFPSANNHPGTSQLVAGPQVVIPVVFPESVRPVRHLTYAPSYRVISSSHRHCLLPIHTHQCKHHRIKPVTSRRVPVSFLQTGRENVGDSGPCQWVSAATDGLGLDASADEG